VTAVIGSSGLDDLVIDRGYRGNEPLDRRNEWVRSGNEQVDGSDERVRGSNERVASSTELVDPHTQWVAKTNERVDAPTEPVAETNERVDRSTRSLRASTHSFPAQTVRWQPSRARRRRPEIGNGGKTGRPGLATARCRLQSALRAQGLGGQAAHSMTSPWHHRGGYLFRLVGRSEGEPLATSCGIC
jgi:hypothetical protein